MAASSLVRKARSIIQHPASAVTPPPAIAPAVVTDKPSYYAGETVTGRVIARIFNPVAADGVAVKVRPRLSWLRLAPTRVRTLRAAPPATQVSQKEYVFWDDEQTETIYEGAAAANPHMRRQTLARPDTRTRARCCRRPGRASAIPHHLPPLRATIEAAAVQGGGQRLIAGACVAPGRVVLPLLLQDPRGKAAVYASQPWQRRLARHGVPAASPARRSRHRASYASPAPASRLTRTGAPAAASCGVRRRSSSR